MKRKQRTSREARIVSAVSELPCPCSVIAVNGRSPMKALCGVQSRCRSSWSTARFCGAPLHHCACHELVPFATRKGPETSHRGLRGLDSSRWRLRSRHINGAGDPFKAATTDEEWLQLDERVNTYPSARTFKAIGTGGEEFVDLMVSAVQKATNRDIDRRLQVSERPSKEGSYLAVSIKRVTVNSGREVLSVYKQMKQMGGSRLKYVI